MEKSERGKKKRNQFSFSLTSPLPRRTDDDQREAEQPPGHAASPCVGIKGGKARKAS